MAHRYFTADITEDTARIAGADAAHLAKALRARPGEKLLLCDGAGMDYEAEITAVTAEEINLHILESHPTESEADVQVTLYVGYGKGDKLEWVLQKAVELGAVCIVPFFSENTVVKPKKEEEKNKRYTRIAHEAAKQSGRGILPVVEMPLVFEQMIKQAAEHEKALFLYEGGGTSLSSAAGGSKNIAIISGPEGGFSPAEALAAKNSGCIIVGLGPRILRCETAPIAALAAVMAISGNLG